jgi:hypothetical protein
MESRSRSGRQGVFRVVWLSGSGTSWIETLAKMKAAASGSSGKSLTSPWRMAKCKPGNARSVVLVIFIVGGIPYRAYSGQEGREGQATTPTPFYPLGDRTRATGFPSAVETL